MFQRQQPDIRGADKGRDAAARHLIHAGGTGHLGVRTHGFVHVDVGRRETNHQHPYAILPRGYASGRRLV